jgi:hypothetical protein
MKISDLILPFKIILCCTVVILTGAACGRNQEHIKTILIPASSERKINKRLVPQHTTPKPIPSDSLVVPDTVESHDRIQKKPEIRIYKRTINFHKTPLIT